VNFIHPRGLFVRVTGSHVVQRFAESPVTSLPRSNFGLADLSVGYEFAHKRGRLSLQVTNALDEEFGVALEGLSIDTILPRRRALLSMRWRPF
jgi:hypothetical protein